MSRWEVGCNPPTPLPLELGLSFGCAPAPCCLSLQEAAERLKSVEQVKFTVSSRTDAGVHALSNAAHLDIHRRSDQPPFSPEVLTQALNTHLRHPAIRLARGLNISSALSSPDPVWVLAGGPEKLCIWAELAGEGEIPGCAASFSVSLICNYRVLQAFQVPSDFHARHAATSRTYLYRLATGCTRHDQLPVFEQNLCWALQTE
jgi:hypothetical protein